MWFVFGIISAIFDTARIGLTKRVGQRSRGHQHFYLTSLANFVYLLPITLLLLPFLNWDAIRPIIITTLIISAGLYVLATVLTTKAADCCDLSATVPFLSFAPLFITLTSAVLLREIPTPLALVGILLIVIGSYFIHFNWADIKAKRWLASLQRLRVNRGAQYILGVAALFGVIGTLNRYLVENLDVINFLILWLTAAGSLAFILTARQKENYLKHLKNWRDLFPINLSYLGMIIADTLGLSLAIAPLVFAVKRVEILLSVLVGAIVYKEHHLSERLFGTLVILVGLVLILIS